MNLPVEQKLKNSFTYVLDGGSLEHVFNFPIAVKNCMDMVKINGHLMFVTPANNYFGHGFYQFSPELFFSLLSEVNGYSDTNIFMQDDKFRWYKVSSPRKIKKRLDICCARKTPALLTVVSRKIGEVPEKLIVLQSDYVDIWTSQKETDVARTPLSLPLYLYRKIPRKVRRHTTPMLKKCLSKFYEIKKLEEFYELCDDFSRTRRKNKEGYRE
jgi:hypothetical protein